jgi:putative MFS transporter
MDGTVTTMAAAPELIARLDRLKAWPYPIAVLWIVGLGYFIAFFDITNVAFGLPIFSKLFDMTPAQQAYPISASLFGYMLGAWLNGNLADYAGRKRGIAFATVLFSVGCAGSMLSNGLLSMVSWRFITGMGIGAEIAIISTYIGELAPASMRGRYTGWINVFSFVGLATVPLLALWLVPNFAWGWRIMFLVGALGILTLPAFALLPESPRWLLGKRRFAEAQAIIEAAEARVRSPEGLPASLVPVTKAIPEAEAKGFPTAQLFHQPYLGRLAMLLGLWFLWYVGEYIWLGLGPTFFVDHGYSLSHSITFMLMSSIGLPVGALLSTWLGDAFERKYSILAGMVIWTAAFAGIAFLEAQLVVYGCVLLVTVALGFVVPLMYTLTNESFPTRARSTGMSLTDGLGHLGGAAGPVVATMVFAAGGKDVGFIAVFLLVAATGLISAAIVPFCVTATRKTLGIAKT